MAKDREILDDGELTEADRVLLELYDRTKEPIPWDASDDAVLAMSREMKLPGAGPAIVDKAPNVADGVTEHVVTNDDTVVPLRGRRAANDNLFARLVRSPGAGLAIAASLAVGLFVGQGITPYVDLGVGPDFDAIVAENEQLSGEVERLGDDLTILRTRIDIDDGGEERTRGIGGGGPLSVTSLVSVLGQFECAALSATVQENARLVVNGHVSSAGDLDRLTNDLAAFSQAGDIQNQAAVYGWPHCEAAEILRGFTQVDNAPADAPVVRPHQHGQVYTKGENLVIEAVAPTSGDAYVYVDFVQHDGTVVHMFPVAGVANSRLTAGQSVVLGQQGQRYTVEAPYGTEMVMVLASPVPLNDEARPQVEPAEDYLAALRAALVRARDEGHTDALRSNFNFLTTQAGN